MVIDGMLVRIPMIGAAASSRSTRAAAPAGKGCFQRNLPQRWSWRSSGPSPTFGPPRPSRMVPLLMLVPNLPSTAGRSVRVAASTAMTESMMPNAIDRNAGLGTIRMAAREARTVRALKATALPAVSTVSATEATIAWRSPGSAPRRSKADRKRMTRKRA